MNDETALGDLVSLWQRRHDEGREVSPAELCRDRPELLPELEQRLAAIRRMDRLADAVGGDTGAGDDLYPTLPPKPGDAPAVPPAATLPSGPEGRVVAPSVPGYEILGVLGRGGMGVVYQARQVGLNRLVALKMILHADHAGAEARARFKSEAEAVARLQHPHIVQIHEVGEHNGLPFFSLEFCPGGSLDKKLGGTPQPPAAAARLVETLARAMHAAHQARVVHRDLKPANVLLTADDTPKITDFGLAKRLGEAGQTHSGAVLGTPSYMAPEQAGGKSREIGPAADVYALGAILYECLTGRPPYLADTAVDTVLQVLSAEPVPPARLNPKVPRDLETVCLKCLHKEPRRRYESAEALADDLGRWWRGEPVRARPPSLVYVLSKQARRYRVALAVTAGVLLTIVLVVALAFGRINAALDRETEARGEAEANLAEVTRQKGIVEQERTTARTALAQEQQIRRELNGQLSQAARFYCDYGEAAFHKGDGREGLNWMLRAYLGAPPDDPLRASYRHLLAAQGDGLGTTFPHLDFISAVAFSPDGRTVLTGSWDRTARLWEAATGRLLATLRHEYLVAAVAYSPDGRTVLTVSHTTARLWEAATGRPLATLRHDAPVEAVAYGPNGRTVLTGSIDQTARLWEEATGRLLATLRHADRVAAVAYGPDGRTVLTGSWDKTARLWETATGRPLATLGHDHRVRAVAYDPSGRTLLTGGDDKTARLWEAATGKLRATLRHEGPVFAVACGPDGRTVLTGSQDGTARLWEAADGKPRATLRHDGPVWAVAYGPDGRTVLTGSMDKTVRLWGARSGELLATFRHAGPVWTVAYGPGGRVVLTGSRDKTARLWGVAAGRPLATLRHENLVTAVACSPDGGTVLTGGFAKTARLWEAATGRLLATLPHQDVVSAVAYASDGRTVLTGSWDKTARLWEAPAGRPLATLRHEGLVAAVAYGPDGRTVLTGSEDRTARLWEAATGRLLATLPHQDAVSAVAYAPDGRTVLTGSGDKTARLWEAPAGRPLATLHHDRGVCAVAFDPSGRTVLTGSADRTARLWEAATGKPLVTFRHEDAVFAVAYGPGGRTVLTGGADRTARIWEASSGRLLATLRHDGYVVAVAYGPDGRTVLTGSWDRTARLWEAATGKPLATFRHEKSVRTVAYGRGGRTVLTAGSDGTARLWEVVSPAPDQPHRLKAWARAETGRAFDPGGVLLPLSYEQRLESRRQLQQAGGDWRTPAPPPQWHRRQVEEAEREEDWFAARFHLKRLLALQPDDLDLLRRRARAHLGLGHWADAAADCTRVLERRPKDAMALQLRARARAQLGQRPTH